MIGDWVWAYHEGTGAYGLFPVTDVIVHTDPTQVHLLLDGELLETTPEHPFYTLERGWVDAGDLWAGAHIRQANGSYGRVQFLAVEREPQVMYNLTVAEAHTFFVGAQRWLVHNATCFPWTIRATDRGKYIEDTLAQTDYSPANGWFRAGALHRGYFPLVDFQKGTTLVSVKSVDTNGSSWMYDMRKHIDELGTRGATVQGQPATMVLDLRVEPGGLNAAQPLIQHGSTYGVRVIIKEFP